MSKLRSEYASLEIIREKMLAKAMKLDVMIQGEKKENKKRRRGQDWTWELNLYFKSE